MPAFWKHGCDAYNYEFVPIDHLMSAPLSDPEMGPLCRALIEWASAAHHTKPGEGPLCFTCDTEFGPGRTVPAAFWFQLSRMHRSKVVAIDALCPVCCEREDHLDRIVAKTQEANPHVQLARKQ
jgi:hypothetical protein